MPDKSLSREDAVDEILDELETVLSTLKRKREADLFPERWRRWKEDAVETLRDRVSAEESAKFARVGGGTLFVAREDSFDAVINEHISFLHALKEHVLAKPERFDRRPNAGSDTPSNLLATVTGQAARVGPPSSLELPETVTAEWLFRNVPARFWLTLVVVVLSLVGTAFWAGVRVGKNPQIREVIETIGGGGDDRTSVPPSVAPATKASVP